jgi:hypothetical protein
MWHNHGYFSSRVVEMRAYQLLIESIRKNCTLNKEFLGVEGRHIPLQPPLALPLGAISQGCRTHTEEGVYGY